MKAAAISLVKCSTALRRKAKRVSSIWGTPVWIAGNCHDGYVLVPSTRGQTYHVNHPEMGVSWKDVREAAKDPRYRHVRTHKLVRK
jgi:hypothetical protein